MLSLYTDGASHAKGGMPGGYASVLVEDESRVILARYGGRYSTTNNAMELKAIWEGLWAISLNYEGYYCGMTTVFDEDTVQKLRYGKFEIVSDSQYALSMTNGSWTPSLDEKGVPKNGILINGIKKLLQSECFSNVEPRYRWVPGHQGNKWNELCDSYAKKGKEESKESGQDFDRSMFGP